MWRYRSEIGTFGIRRGESGEYELWLNENLLGACDGPDQAARHVATCTTGFTGWDCKGSVKEPNSLNGWTEIELDSEAKDAPPQRRQSRAIGRQKGEHA